MNTTLFFGLILPATIATAGLALRWTNIKQLKTGILISTLLNAIFVVVQVFFMIDRNTGIFALGLAPFFFYVLFFAFLKDIRVDPLTAFASTFLMLIGNDIAGSYLYSAYRDGIVASLV